MNSILSNNFEVNSKMDKRNRIAHTKYEATKEEREDIICNIGSDAFLLYQFYLRMAAIPDASMEDKDVITYYPGWSIRKTANNRKALEHAGYFKKITYKANNGKKSITYYISKEAVNNS